MGKYLKPRITTLARDLGWQGEVHIFRYEDMGEEGSATVHFGGHGKDPYIALAIPKEMKGEDAFEEAEVQLLHAIHHDPEATSPGIGASHPAEETMTYVRGADTAKHLGVADRFQRVGRRYTAWNLAKAEAYARVGKSQPTRRGLERAGTYIDERGFEDTAKRIKKLKPRGW